MIGNASFDEIKSRLKQTTQDLGSRMLQAANCSIESFKVWQAW